MNERLACAVTTPTVNSIRPLHMPVLVMGHNSWPFHFPYIKPLSLYGTLRYAPSAPTLFQHETNFRPNISLDTHFFLAIIRSVTGIHFILIFRCQIFACLLPSFSVEVMYASYEHYYDMLPEGVRSRNTKVILCSALFCSEDALFSNIGYRN